MEIKVNQNLIPVEMTREQHVSLAGSENYKFGRVKIGTRLTTGILVPADNENQYRELIHSEWNEEKDIERQRRCMVKSPKTGKLIKCKGCCEQCERMKDGQPISLDGLYEGTEYEASDDHQSIRGIDAELLFRQLLELLEKQAPELAHIFEELYHGTGQRELEREMNIAHGTMTDLVKRMRGILQQYVTREDITG